MHCLFLFQKLFISAFLVQIRNQLLKTDPCAKFRSSNFDLERYQKLLDDVILHSDDISKIIIDFLRFFPEYQYAKFGGNWKTNNGKTEGAQCAPSLYFTKKPQPE